MECLSGPECRALTAPAPGPGATPEQKESWHISNITLAQALKARVDEIVAEFNREEREAGYKGVPRKQTVLPEGVFNPMLLTLWKEPPRLYIEINVEPGSAAEKAKVKLQDLSNHVLYEDRACIPRPLRFEDLAAVTYLVEVEIKAEGLRKPLVINPALPGVKQTVNF
jgi:hypothetical protein